MVILPTGDKDIGSIVRQLRIRANISRVQLGTASGVSTSHLARIENGQRLPSAKVLRKIAPHLRIGEIELLAIAGYVSIEQYSILGNQDSTKLDPNVAALLSQESVEVQRAVVTILSVIKYVVESITREQARTRTNNLQKPISN